MRSGEFATLARLAQQFESAPSFLRVGIGDDAAVLDPPPGMQLVWTVDEQLEGTHFRRAWLGGEDIGWRALMAAASDVAAMGAMPWCALAAWTLSGELDDADVDALTRGTQRAARSLNAPIVGGNLSRGGALSLTTTVLGACSHPIKRSGALPGDGIYVAGTLGLAAAGLAALERGAVESQDPTVDHVIAAWKRPSALVEDGLRMALVAHAAIDVSDGLAQDLGHVAAASGVRAVLDEMALTEHAHGIGLVVATTALRLDPLELILHGGEDYALVVASPEPIPGFWRVGSFEEGTGVVLRGVAGDERSVAARGFDHFR